MLSPVEELYFWSGIMGDHAEFILTLLSPKETEFIKKANYFKSEWIKINHESERLMASKMNKELVNQAISLLKEFIEYKKLILSKLLTCEIGFNHVPSFINHMLNEANEFYRNLYLSLENKKMNTVDELILLHKLWLRDAAGHAAAVAGGLDPNEALLVKEANEFKEKFNLMFIKTYELGLMIERTRVETNAIIYLNEEVNKLMDAFVLYLDKIKKLRLECKIMGYLVPEIPDHMIREEKYYIAKVNKAI